MFISLVLSVCEENKIKSENEVKKYRKYILLRTRLLTSLFVSVSNGSQFIFAVGYNMFRKIFILVKPVLYYKFNFKKKVIEENISKPF